MYAAARKKSIDPEKTSARRQKTTPMLTVDEN